MFATNTVFNIFDLVVGILLVVGGVVSFGGTFTGVIIPIYIILFGVLVIVMVFYIPPLLNTMIPFYMNFLGRGLTFLFLGCLVLVGTGNTGVKMASAIITLCCAFTYMILWILMKCNVVPCGLPPPFMQTSSSGSSATSNDANKKSKDEAPTQPTPASAYDEDEDETLAETR